MNILKNQVSIMCIIFAAVIIYLASAGMAFAQSGHFVGDQVCTDIGTQVQCKGKVAGLGGTTFQINVAANGTAIIECENPGENVAPGQDTEVTALGGSGPLATPRNGQYRYTVSTNTPTVPNVPTCPNEKWTAHVVDVTFTTATITLLEDNVISDQVTVPVQ
ncbi:hypothetical protein [Nitrosomonas communis]|uniref:Uncharacterized protein n=1 Tax=Nitrosomonas communis TaxID=44574 RepID=A0A1I4TDA8_9PROT|nr:hypothetical protein [Nitrosomonas communis]SFM74672.1 hypothetical protein SAMN05421863_104926 [Nitrosomonas communis]